MIDIDIALTNSYLTNSIASIHIINNNDDFSAGDVEAHRFQFFWRPRQIELFEGFEFFIHRDRRLCL